MTPKYKVWLVDDLPRNESAFEKNHGADFAVETFSKTSEVLQRIQRGEYPDALLCDVFFYDNVAQAEDVEAKVQELANKLREKAIEIGAYDHRYTAGVGLMRQIHEHFRRQPLPFPMYAYTSKGPLLLEQSEWNRISEYGAQVLLKGRVTPDAERTEIVGDIEILRRKRSWTAKLKAGIPSFLWQIIVGLVVFAIGLVIGRGIHGYW
jgi:CheY-like chemotaxis protein